MTIGDAWREITRDPDWKRKVGMAMLITLIPYVGQFYVMGWTLEFERDLAWGRGGVLPDLRDTSRIGKKAIGAFAVSLIYSLPLMVVIMPVSFAWGFAVSLAAENHEVGTSVALGVALFAFSMLAALAYLPISYSALLRFTLYDDIAAALKFRELFATMRRTAGALTRVCLRIVGVSAGITLVSVALVGLIAAMVISAGQAAAAVLVLLPVLYVAYLVALFAISVVTMLLSSALFGLYAREAYDLRAPDAA